MPILKDPLRVLFVDSTQATAQPTLARHNQFIVEHTCIGCNAIGDAWSAIRLDMLRKQSSEVHQNTGTSFTPASGFFAQTVPLVYSVPVVEQRSQAEMASLITVLPP